jgi:hypothetical protein
MDYLSKAVAHRIIERVGGPGQPPEYGFQFFTAGLDKYLNVIREEYLASFIKDGGSTFKLVVGVYGGGKTHFLLCVRDAAWAENFVTANVDLSPTQTPFSRLELVYKDIISGMTPPLSADELLSGGEHGIESFLHRWYERKRKDYIDRGYPQEEAQKEIINDIELLRGIESSSFLKAFQASVHAIIDKNEEQFATICQWLKGEGLTSEHRRLGILQKIDKATAFEMIRSLNQLIRQLGYSGMVIAFDEAEQQGSMSAKDQSTLLDNLRQVIDECTKTTFQNIMIFYAVPNEEFLVGRTNIYEALRQRVDTVFEQLNPSGVKISLEKVIDDPLPFMTEVGEKLAIVFQEAYGPFIDPSLINPTIHSVADIAMAQRFGNIGYKRLFVQRLVKGFHFLRIKGVVPSSSDLSS